jgi:hypothetical protein
MVNHTKQRGGISMPGFGRKKSEPVLNPLNEKSNESSSNDLNKFNRLSSRTRYNQFMNESLWKALGKEADMVTAQENANNKITGHIRPDDEEGKKTYVKDLWTPLRGGKKTRKAGGKKSRKTKGKKSRTNRRRTTRRR